MVKALVDAGFEVSALTRAKKLEAHDARVKQVEADFASLESLTAALKGVDAVVSTVAGSSMNVQTVLIDAAVAAGVKRFIPSEFGSVSTNPKLENFPLYNQMFQIKKRLQENAEAGKLTWTVLRCGAFLEFLLNYGMLMDFTNHKGTFYDGGDNRISSTSMANIGKAIAGILKNFEATKNKIMTVSEVIVTQNKVLNIAKELRPDIKWDITEAQTSDMLKEGLDATAAGDFSMPSIMKIIGGTALAGEKYGAAYDVTDNELLGVKELTEDDVTKLVAAKLS